MISLSGESFNRNLLTMQVDTGSPWELRRLLTDSLEKIRGPQCTQHESIKINEDENSLLFEYTIMYMGSQKH